MQKNIALTLFFFCFLFSIEADHVIFNKIVTSPSEAELVSIYNPTEIAIDLSDYYLSDAEYENSSVGESNHYYNLPVENNFWSELSSDFIVKFPLNTIIDPQETIIITLTSQLLFFFLHFIRK